MIEPKKTSSSEISDANATEKRHPGRRKRFAGILSLVLIGGLAALVCWKCRESAEFVQNDSEAQALDADARFRGMILGTWEDEFQGRRTLTLVKGGTGTMIVELEGWRAAMSAPRLKFDLKWSVEAGRLKKQTVGGEPEAQVKMILSAMGDRVDEPILELTKDRLLLLDRDGKTKYDWKRVK